MNEFPSEQPPEAHGKQGSLRLTQAVHAFLRGELRPGDIALDATAGNGHDTAFLADLVGAQGSVLAFDVQERALARTAKRLLDAEKSNVELIQANHARMGDIVSASVRGQVAAIVFNLGYLPRGDKALVTETSSTLTAIFSALSLLRPGGVLSVLAYPGHPGGEQEACAVERALDALDPGKFRLERRPHPTQSFRAPRWFLVRARDPLSPEDTGCSHAVL